MVVSTAVMHLVQGGCLQVTERLKLQLQAHLLSESSAEMKNPSLSQLRMNFIVKKKSSFSFHLRSWFML